MPATAAIETVEAKEAASDAASHRARGHARGLRREEPAGRASICGVTSPATASRGSSSASAISSPSSIAGSALVAVSTISSGKPGKDTPTGIFPILEKKRLHRSIKYDNAPMPFMQRIDEYGIALHAGHLPGHPASHGCVRLPGEFAAKLFRVTEVGTPVLIGA